MSDVAPITEKPILPIGMICLAIAILVGRYGTSLPGSDFIEGFFVGLSIALNLYYVYKIRS